MVSGAIEMATEYLPLFEWLDILKGNGKSTWLNLLISGAGEGTEEAVSYLANYAADLAAQDPNANFSLEELLESAGMGAASGGIYGGVGVGLNAARRALIGQQAAQADTGNGEAASFGNESLPAPHPSAPAGASTFPQGGRQAAAQTEASQRQTTMPDSEKEELFRLFMSQSEAAQDGAAQQTAERATLDPQGQVEQIDAETDPARAPVAIQAAQAQAQTETAQQQTALPGDEQEELFQLFMSRPEAAQNSTAADASKIAAAQTQTETAQQQNVLPDDEQEELFQLFMSRPVTETTGSESLPAPQRSAQSAASPVSMANGGTMQVSPNVEQRRQTVAAAPLGKPERGGTVQYGKGVQKGSTQLPAEVLDAAAKKLGTTVRVVQSLTDGSGSEVNGHWAAGLAEMVISEKSGNAFQTLVHETGEYIKTNNPEGWAHARSSMIGWYASGRGMDAAQRNVFDRYESAYGDSARGADEAARDLFAGIFSTEEGTRSFLEYLDSDETMTEPEKRSVVQTLRDILDRLIESIRALLRGGDATIGAAEGRMLAERADQLENSRALMQVFLTELENARQNAQAASEAQQQNTADSEMPAAASEDVRASKAVNGNGKKQQKKKLYDIKKPFAQQVKDAIEGRMPAKNNILVGRAPKVFQDIGLGTLPLTMTWRHANTVYYASAEEAVKGNKAFKPEQEKEEHFHGMGDKIYDMPKKLADPIAIIKSRTHSDSSVVVIVDETDNNIDEKSGFDGNDVMGAITIGTSGMINGYTIDTDRIGSYYGGEGNKVIKLFTDALINEKSGDSWVLYIDAQKAKNIITKRAKIAFKKDSTKPAALQKGELSSINTIQQSGRVVNKNDLKAEADLQKQIDDALLALDAMKIKGSVVLHKVNDIARKELLKANVTDTRQFKHFFGSSKVVDGNGNPLVLYTVTNTAQAAEQNDVVSGVRLTVAEQSGGRGQEAVYASIRRPFRVDNPATLQRYLNHDGQYRRLRAEGKEQQARDRATEYLKDRRFDGVHLLNDGNGAEVWIAFAGNQIKSATDNVGTFDPRVNDRYYSRPVTD